MKNPLFLSKERSLEKTAVGKLSKNPDDWETEIIEMLHEQHPYITESKVAVTLKKTDADTGAGIGQILVDDTAAIPVIVQDFKLSPMDVFYADNELHALKRDTLEAETQQPELGKPVKPQSGEMTDVSIQRTTEAPVEGKYSYAEDLSYSKGDVERALSVGLTDDGLKYEIATNPIFREVVANLLAHTDKIEKVAEDTTVYSVTPKKDTFTKLASTGVYEVVTSEGFKTGLLFREIIPLGNEDLTPKTGATLFVSLDKTAHEITREPVGVREPSTKISLPESDISGTGVFWTIKEGAAAVTEPVTVLWSNENRHGLRTAMGHTFTVEIRPEFSGIEKIGNTLYMGQSWIFTKIGKRTNISRTEAANDYAWLKTAQRTYAPKKSVTLTAPELTEEALRSFVKTAAMFDVVACGHLKLSEEKAKETVDTLLNLNFLNAQNISRFVEHIDKLAEAKQAVAELLLATKLGLDLDSMPLRTALFALDQVEQDLKELRNSQTPS